MKKNSLIIILLVIIAYLVSYIGYDKINNKKDIDNNLLEEKQVEIVDNISLDYVNIYLTSDGLSYISPINQEEIKKLSGKNLKERLTTLYERAFYYDIYINNNKLKGFKIELDDEINKIRKIELEDNSYIIFIKENNTIGLFNYEEYYNLLNTTVVDNYNNLKDIKDVVNKKIIYLDGSKEDFGKKK